MADRHVYTLKRPASWFGEMWREALPLGNGLTSALIPGAIAEESVTFNRHDLWHNGDPGGDLPDVTATFADMRRAIDAGDYAAANQDNLNAALREKGYEARVEVPYPLGWLTMSFTPEAAFRHYRRGVDMRAGEAFVDFEIDGCRYHRRMFISRADDIAALRLTADEPFTTVFNLSLFDGEGAREVDVDGLRVTAADGDTAASMRVIGRYESAVREGALAVTGRDYTVLVRCASHGSPLDLDAFAGETYESLLARHKALHTALYDAATIELADDDAHAATNEQLLDEAYDDQASPALLERLWRFGRYLFIASAAEDGVPVPLYGRFHGGDKLQWSQFTANENVQMTYWHALAGGLSYALPPLIHYYTEKTEAFRQCARRLFGMRGIWVSAYTSPHVAGACVRASVIINWISCAGWLCRHFWDYYLYSGDEAMLRDEILPFMREAALFYQDYAVRDGETLRLYPSVSPENTPGNLMNADTHSPTGHRCPAVQNALMDFAVMKELLTNLLTGMEITGLYAEEAQGFRDLLARIPAYAVNADGAVKEWLSDDLEDNYHHRHLSHLYPVFPGDEVTAHSDPALFEAFRKAVTLRKLGSQSGWSLTHMANIYARFGEAEKAVGCLDIMAKSVVNAALFTVHNDWRHMGMTVEWQGATFQLDAAFGAVNAIQEMLFRWQGDALSILPALPERLASGRVKGMAFPGGTADIAWDKAGHVRVQIHAARALDMEVFVFGAPRGRVTLSAGQTGALEVDR